jgi:hypothetical protein
MHAPVLLCLAVCGALFQGPLLAAVPAILTTTPLLNDPVAGQALAADLRNAQPVASAQLSGLLKLRRSADGATTLPLLSRIIPKAKSWQAFYQVTASNWTEALLVTHSPATPNEYRCQRQPGTNGCLDPLPLCQQIWQPFAGSDFSLADLGLEFYHWPTQILVMNEMRKNRACHVLESRPAVTNDYARVLSWVDVESGGLLMAEAYNARNQRLKEFEVKRFKKTGDQWQVQELEMRHFKDGSRANGSRTILEFEVTQN